MTDVLTPAEVTGTAEAKAAGRVRHAGRVVAVTATGLSVAALVPFGDTRAGTGIALAGVVFLVVASLVTMSSPADRDERVEQPQPSRRRWLAAYAGLGLFCAGVTQLWFRGRGIAAGDVSPPAGTAWIGDIFAPWRWYGGHMGAPLAPIQLPYAALSGAVQSLGGSATLAQNLWYTFLVTSCALLALTLMRLAGLGVAAATVGALFYTFNPYSLSQASINQVYWATLALLPALLAIMLAVARGRLSTWRAVLLLSCLAPLISWVAQSPPLLVLVVAASLACGPAALLVSGRAAARRVLRTQLAAAPALVAVCAYWIVPIQYVVTSISTESLSTTASWAFTENRATLANAWWLNNNWGWAYPQYFPYTEVYSTPLFRLAMYAAPLLAVAGLLAARGRTERRLAGLAGLLAAFFVFISTGTRAPGNVLFDVLYELPLGWLLREPGRFLVIPALAYAFLVALAVRAVAARLRSSSRLSEAVPIALCAGFGSVLLLLPAFPLLTGEVVLPAQRGFPSQRTVVPSYWTDLAARLNAPTTPPGRVLVLPTNDFYQVPYTWYYGHDAFITDLVERPVLDPVESGYIPSSAALHRAAGQVSEAILSRNSARLRRLLGALGTDQVLVRGDVVATFPGRTIDDPAELMANLDAMPGVEREHRSGPLAVYRVQLGAGAGEDFVTTNSSSPDLRRLDLFAPGTHFVTSPAVPGRQQYLELPELAEWQRDGNRLNAVVDLPKQGWRYRSRLTVGGAQSDVALRPGTTSLARGLTVELTEAADGLKAHFAQALGPTLVRNGDFREGPWQPLGDCAYQGTPARSPALQSAVVRRSAQEGGGLALRLSASIHSACVTAPVTRVAGPVVVSFQARSVGGAPAHACLWDQVSGSCLVNEVVPDRRGWQSIQLLVNVPERSRLTLFLYADASIPGTRTVAEYANVDVRSVSEARAESVLGVPATRDSSVRLVRNGEGFSRLWSGPGKHVLVDGITNGWLTSNTLDAPTPTYRPEPVIRLAQVVSVLGLAVVLAVGPMSWARSARRREGVPDA